MITGTKTVRNNVRVVLAALLIAAGCTSTAAVSGPAEGEARATVAAVEPTVAPSNEIAEPEPTAEAQAATAVPTAAPEPGGEPVEMRTDSLLGISNDGVFAYGGTTSPWNTATTCDAVPFESLGVVNIADAAAGNATPVGARLLQAGDVHQLLIANDAAGQIATVSSCESPTGQVVWLQGSVVGADGRIVAPGQPIELAMADNERLPVLLHWDNVGSVVARVIVEVDPDDFDSWTVEHRSISLSSGAMSTIQTFTFDDEGAFGSSAELTTESGRIYRAIEDPDGSVGCEGAGVARTIEVQDQDGVRLAMGLDGPVFSDVAGMHTASTGHIAWTSGCEGFTTAYVGKILDDGTIVDVHFIDQPLVDDSFVDYVAYHLTDDGFLAGVGLRGDFSNNDPTLAFLRHDLSTDPHFIHTADPAPVIDADPLFQAADGVSSWHVGDTLGATPACGGRTLYGKTSTGFVRALPTYLELDAIVDAAVSDVRTITFDDGGEFSSRTVVVQTECPGDYTGRRVWFGTEAGRVRWGLGLEQADLGAITEVADVLAVRDVVEEGTNFVQTTLVQLELLDGSVVEIELVALPHG